MAHNEARSAVEQVIVSVSLHQLDRHAEQARQMSRRQDILLAAIAKDRSVFQQNDAADFREDIRRVMGDENDARGGPRNLAQDFSQLASRPQVQTRSGLVEDEGPRIMD